MKIFILACIVFVFSGCIRDYCRTCTTTYRTTYSDNTSPSTVSFTSEMCDENIYDIDEYEEENSFTTTIVHDGVTEVVEVTMDCTEE